MAPQACLLDSGATAVRFDSAVAEICGIDLTGAPEQEIAVGGGAVTGRMAEVSLAISDGTGTGTGTGSHQWTAPVWFCEPWRPAFGLLGLTGFFDQFVVTIASYEEWVEIEPVNL